PRLARRVCRARGPRVLVPRRLRGQGLSGGGGARARRARPRTDRRIRRRARRGARCRAGARHPLMDLLVPLLLGVLAIAASTALGGRLGVASPLLLLAVGIAVGYLPFVHLPEINPEWILIGVLPPLLYSAAVNLPAIEFLRDLRPIAGLSVILVVVSSLLLGLFFWA